MVPITGELQAPANSITGDDQEFPDLAGKLSPTQPLSAPNALASQTSLPNSGENNESTPLHPEPLNVAPISCFPYTGPPLPDCYDASASPDITIGSVPVETDFKHTNSQQHAGPLIGSVDIAESEDNYLFRVSLPGVVRNEKVFSCEVGPNGEISIKGVSDTGKNTVRKSRMIFKMQTQNLCPSGEFSVSFQLPGPVDHQNLNCVFGSDGIFEGVVKKNKAVGPLSGGI